MSDYYAPEQLPLFDNPTEHPDFDGDTIHEDDKPRLETALGRVYWLMRDGKRRTLAEIARQVGCSEAGASARLRDLRKPKFKARYPEGTVERERLASGVWVYWMDM